MRKIEVLEDIIQTFEDRDIEPSKKEILAMFEALDPNTSDLIEFGKKEWVVEHCFSDKANQNYTNSHDQDSYFAQVIMRCIE